MNEKKIVTLLSDIDGVHILDCFMSSVSSAFTFTSMMNVSV